MLYFDLMEQDIKDVLEALDFIKKKVEDLPPGNEIATKDDIRAIARDETKDIRTELTSIRRSLGELTAKADNTAGFTKEIDHALARIARIEKHLGISSQFSA